jgi:hypothetical protein
VPPPPQRSGQSALPPHIELFLKSFEKQIERAHEHAVGYLEGLKEKLTKNPDQLHELILGADRHDQLMMIPVLAETLQSLRVSLNSQGSSHAYETYVALQNALLTLLQRHSHVSSSSQRVRMIDLGNQNPEFVAEMEQLFQKRIKASGPKGIEASAQNENLETPSRLLTTTILNSKRKKSLK